MKFKVRFKMYTDKEVVVDAVDRWDAVDKAANELKLDSKYPLSHLSSIASVRKLERKRRREW